MALGTPTIGTIGYSGTSTITPSYPASIVAGDCLVLIVGQKPITANGGGITTPTGWTLQDSLTGAGGYGTTLGIDTGNTNLYFFTKNTVTGSETGTLSVTLANNNTAWAGIVRVPTSAGNLSYQSSDGQQTSTPTTSLSVSLSSVSISAQTDDLFLTAMCLPTDVTTPNQFTSGQTTISGLTVTNTELGEPDSSSGNDIGGFIGSSKVTAGSATGNPTFTATLTGTLTNVRGPVVTLRIRETLPERTGSLSATETGVDAFSASGDVIVEGSLAATETDNDTFSASGTVATVTSGTFQASETGADTFASTGDVVVSGSLAVSETGNDTFDSQGSVTGAIVGDLHATETGNDTASFTGQIYVIGTLSATELSDTFAATGTVLLTGSLAATESGLDAFDSQGTTAGSIVGDLHVTEVGNDAFSSTGQIVISGALAVSETEFDSFLATGTEVISGSFAATESGGSAVGNTYVDINTGKIVRILTSTTAVII